MPMTKESMATFIQAQLVAMTHIQTDNPAAAATYGRQVLEAFCQGIIDEIQANALVTTTSGAPDGEHTGGVS